MHIITIWFIGGHLLVNYYGNVKTCTKMAIEHRSGQIFFLFLFKERNNVKAKRGKRTEEK